MYGSESYVRRGDRQLIKEINLALGLYDIRVALCDLHTTVVGGRELGVPVCLENDALALAEARYGAGRGGRDLLCVTLGIDIGAGCIVSGELVRGAAALVLDDLFRVPHFAADPRPPRALAGTAGAV